MLIQKILGKDQLIAQMTVFQKIEKLGKSQMETGIGHNGEKKKMVVEGNLKMTEVSMEG